MEQTAQYDSDTCFQHEVDSTLSIIINLSQWKVVLCY